MSESKPERNILVYTDADIQSVAEDMGYNTLSEKRINQIIENLCFSEDIFDMINENIIRAIRFVMEETKAEHTNGE